ncbi:MAG: TonB-dependent receptor [Alteromonadaceae bacterium]|uniref:TonB-dependent receptor n=1 Tax=Paraglaciecola chathamensis TaxID=368405 RepID=UPI000C599292|nr:TonB-dependent receptor [Paraglaciecola agarilytica]MBN27826.1 TonB-dependent receptor [Alteromonadaceae bacterium]|tara:strand:- start:9910 stop:12342 length:2433 start_codon:yes stop_codon:yes gene_type:complete
MKLNRLTVAVATALIVPSISVFGQTVDDTALDNKTIEQITVTAQYKEQTLLETGLAIDALDSNTISQAGITKAEDLTRLVPALSITNGGGTSSQIYMRGVGNKANSNYLDPAIVLTYDGVALARGSANAIGAFYDIERVEVLKGPQGTLYGKNATGGVLNIVTVKPKLGETSGFVNATLGNYNTQNISGAVNLPVGEDSAFRLSASKTNHDGYNNDGSNNDDKTNFRLQFLSEISDKFKVRIAADSTEIGGVASSGTPIGNYSPSYDFIPSGLPNNEGSTTELANDYRNTVLSAPGFGFLNSFTDDQFIDATLRGINAELTYIGEAATVTFIPAYRKSEQSSKFVGPGFNFGWFQTEEEQTSFELRMTGSLGSSFDYIAGIFAIDEDVKGNNTFNQEFVLPLQDYTQTAESRAIFGEGTWYVTDEFRLITGLRFTKDKKTIDGQIENYIVFCGGLPPALITPPGSFAHGCATPGNLPHFPTLDTPEQADQWLVDNGWASNFIPIPPGFLIPLDNGIGQILHTVTPNKSSYSDSEPTFKISSEWDVADDSMLYLSYTSGYRSGGLQPSSGLQYESEFLDAITFGSNNLFLDGALQFKAEVFYWDYQDQQITYFNVNEHNVLENTTDNVGAATNKGFDIDLIWKLTDNTTIDGKVQYLKASYDDLKFTTSPPRDNINCPSEVTGALDDGTPVIDFDCSGNQSIFAPELTLKLGIDHIIPMGSFNVVLSLDTTWVDDQVTGFTNRVYEVIGAHSRTNAYLTVEDADNRWSARLYARNLEDKNRLTSTQDPVIGVAQASYGEDMTYGLSVNYNF